MKQHRVEGQTAYLDRAWGTLIMDVEDLPLLDGFGLEVRNGYVRLRGADGKRPSGGSLSRAIMGNPTGLVVDHANHNTLDNRKCNLRICERSHNARNNMGQRTRKVSRFKGVYYHPAKKYNARCSEDRPWRAYTSVHGKRIWFGYYATEVEAAMAYNRNAAQLFGEFACFNRIEACPVLNTSREATGCQAECQATSAPQ